MTLLPERVFARAAMVFDPDPQNLDKIRSQHSKQDPSVTIALRGHLPGWRESDQIVTVSNHPRVDLADYTRNIDDFELLESH